MLELAQVATPPSLRAPFDWLGAPMRGVQCEEPMCSRISTSRDEIRKHRHKEHTWRSVAEDPEHWHAVYVQTMVQSKSHRRYFVVNYHDASVQELEESLEDINPPSQQVLEQ